MNVEVKFYPGEVAAPELLLELADEYRQSAMALRQRGTKGKPLSWAPFRLTAIQAVELYLNVFLLQRGLRPMQVRSMGHDLGRRSVEATAAGLKLRKRTADHLQQLSDQREYLISRYGPELSATTSQINRLAATLDEVARKVAAYPHPSRSAKSTAPH